MRSTMRPLLPSRVDQEQIKPKGVARPSPAILGKEEAGSDELTMINCRQGLVTYFSIICEYSATACTLGSEQLWPHC